MTDGFVIYVTDTETTGLDAVENDVIEISMCRLIIPAEGDIIQDQKTWCLKALNPKTIQAEALAVNGHKRDDILHLTKYGKETYIHPSEVLPQIELWIMEDEASSLDRIFIGHNPNFDINAMQELWKRNNSIETFPFSLERGNRILDTKQVAILIDICVGKRRKFYNLGSLVKDFGVKKGKAHQAAEDVRMTVDLLIKFITPLKKIMIENFSECYSD